jgi:hypothetical protein
MPAADASVAPKRKDPLNPVEVTGFIVTVADVTATLASENADRTSAGSMLETLLDISTAPGGNVMV